MFVLDTSFDLLYSVPCASVFLLEAQGTTSGFSRQEVLVIVRVTRLFSVRLVEHAFLSDLWFRTSNEQRSAFPQTFPPACVQFELDKARLAVKLQRTEGSVGVRAKRLSRC